MGSRYLFICLYVWLEKYFSRGDYKKQPAPVKEPQVADVESDNLAKAPAATGQ
jgi:hypothetical protein